MRRVEVSHFCLTKNPKSPWHQGIDVATATLQLMRYLLNDGILIMVYEIISTYLGSMSSPTHSLNNKTGPFLHSLMWFLANHLVPWWRPELLAKSWQKKTAKTCRFGFPSRERSKSGRCHASSICVYNLYTKP